MLKLKELSYSLHKLQWSDFWPFLHPVPSVPHSNCKIMEEGNKTHIYKNLASGKKPFKEFTSWLMVYMTCHLRLFLLLPQPHNLWSKLNVNYCTLGSFLSLFSIYMSLGMESARNWTVRPTSHIHTPSIYHSRPYQPPVVYSWHN